MRVNNIEKRFPCPPGALIHPILMRVFSVPVIFFICWAAVFFKSRAAGAVPWIPLLLAAVFILGILAVEVVISARFARFLAPMIFGFLAGAVVNVIVQSLLDSFQGLNWAFQSPIQVSLGFVLLGFVGSLTFLSIGDRVNQVFLSSGLAKSSETSSRHFSALVWVVTLVMVAAIGLSLWTIQKEFSELESKNPLRQPVLFSVGAVLLVVILVLLNRKNLLRLARVFLPGAIVGLVWAFVVRDVFEGVYIAYSQFPLATEVLELLLVVNLGYLGVAWLNRASSEAA